MWYLWLVLCFENQCSLLVYILVFCVFHLFGWLMQGILELRKSHKDLPCDSFQFFTHGGMIFLFTTSAMFAVVSVNLLYVIHTHTHTETCIQNKHNDIELAHNICVIALKIYQLASQWAIYPHKVNKMCYSLSETVRPTSNPIVPIAGILCYFCAVHGWSSPEMESPL